MPWGRRNYNRTQHSNDSDDTVKWYIVVKQSECEKVDRKIRVKILA